ncbi:MAG: hypothetical protein IRY98_02675 [Alicyclobacillaceae bacterium]|nr:hypothetical protein [Alicyclobacillaceae bacterium]
MGIQVTVVGKAKEDAFSYWDFEQDRSLRVARLTVEGLQYEGLEVEEVVLLLAEGQDVEQGGMYRVTGELGPRRVVTRSGKMTRLPIWEIRADKIEKLS